jgi:hypothetical protein
MDTMHTSRRCTRRLSFRAGAAVVSAAAAIAVAGSIVPALAAQTSATAAKATVYQGKVVNQHAVLGPQSAPTNLVSTRVLPAGKYMVTATVAAVIAPNDQIVCAVSNVPDTNDGVFGTAGNPASSGGIYGTATITDTITVSAGQRLWLGCNSFNYGKGTYAGSAVLEAVPAYVHGS